jgi:DNA primase small subunit
MYAFYQRLFPWRPLFQWLNHSPVPCNDFSHREFAFTLQNDSYLRYRSFPTFETLKKETLTLNPSRFEIGPVYSAIPRERKRLHGAAFKPVAKELIFDIDLTDYDDVRTCCEKANICIKCWNFITVAIKIMNAALKEDFGFKHVIWVYSGRRGAHAWVCDKKARLMDDQKRRTIATYLEVVRGGDKAAKKVNIRRPLHPHLERSMDILKGYFLQDVLRNQDPWRDDEKAEKLLGLFPDKSMFIFSSRMREGGRDSIAYETNLYWAAFTSELRKKWGSTQSLSSEQKWNDIEAATSRFSKAASSNLKKSQLRDAKDDIYFEYLYPRLDAEVSKHLNHLLKSPFVVHPGTGRVCVPIDSKNPENFDPLAVPTVTQLLAEIDEWNSVMGKAEASGGDNGTGRLGQDEQKIPDYEKTSLKPYIDYFKKFVAGLLKDETVEIKRERSMGGDPMEF